MTVSLAEVPLERVEIAQDGGVKEVMIPAITRTIERQVERTPARTIERSVPAVLKQVETVREVTPERVEERVREDGSIERVTVPPTYETVTETIIDQEARTEIIIVPAQMETINETVIVEEARTEARYAPPQFASAETRTRLATAPFNWNDIADALNYAEFIPPRTDLTYFLDADVFTGGPDADISLRGVHDRIVGFVEAEQDDNMQWRLFRYPGGFVILTSPERIDENARPIKVDGNRIAVYDESERGFWASIRRFFRPDEKRFRAISFTVRTQDAGPGEAFGDGGDLNDLVASSSESGPAFLNYLDWYYLRHHGFQVVAAVHEFESVLSAEPVQSDWSQFRQSRRPFTRAKHRSGSDIIDRAHKPVQIAETD